MPPCTRTRTTALCASGNKAAAEAPLAGAAAGCLGTFEASLQPGQKELQVSTWPMHATGSPPDREGMLGRLTRSTACPCQQQGRRSGHGSSTFHPSTHLRTTEQWPCVTCLLTHFELPNMLHRWLRWTRLRSTIVRLHQQPHLMTATMYAESACMWGSTVFDPQLFDLLQSLMSDTIVLHYQ
jgi:hypothetical protein